ncbi:MAG: M20/M25/M40 family metallo-hydrolase [Pseudomonadota bacterium]
MKKAAYKVFLAAAAAAGLMADALASEEAVQAARDYRAANAPSIIKDFADLLMLPNDAANIEDMRLNAQAISAMFAKRGFATELLQQEGVPPLIYGRLQAENATRTIAIYVHYDGQPTEDANWTHPPFEPVLYSKAISAGGEVMPFPVAGDEVDPEWRLYARSASDDKAPIAALLSALDALQERNIVLTSNIVLVFDGEEERGSDHLDEYLAAHADKFADVDLWLFCDGPTHQSGRPQLVFGARGVTGMEVTVYGPNRGLHSGHYGNWAPGPGWRLSRLLASMKAADGKVRIKNFYKSTTPLSEADRAALAAAPPVDDALRREFGLAQTEDDNAPLAQRIMLPALNIKGIKSAEVGENARNIIPPSATASLGIRLVKGNDPEKMKDLVEAHIRRQGYHLVREEPDAATRMKHPLIAKVVRESGYRAVRSAMDSEATAPLVKALSLAADDLILTPSLGGTLPLYVFEDVSEAPIVILPIANFDNNQHAADENIRLGNLFYGIDAYAAVLTME